MKPMKRMISFCLMLCLLLSMLPVMAFAAEAELPEKMRFVCINPLYADTVTEEELAKPGRPLLNADNTGGGKYYDAETAGQMIRDDLVARDTTISVNISFPYNEATVQQDAEQQIYAIMASAVAHTGNPKEGDYLLWQYTGFNAEFGNYTFTGGNLGATVTFTMTYHADAAQEAEVDAAVNQLLGQLNVTGKDTYTKLKAIYDYITANVTYDYENLNNNSYKLKHTAYAALINKTAVCQGYAALLYRLALELGVDCRMIPGNSQGQGHIWNIAKLDGKYYNLDATWDAGIPIYQCFLKGSDNFPDHKRWDTAGQMPISDSYNSDAFHAAYPMAKEDYTGGCDHAYTPSVTAPTCTEKGYTTYTCSACGDAYTADEVAALGHNEVTDKGYAATCTETGLTDGVHCDRCDAVLTAQKTISATGHAYDEGVVTKDPTEETTGVRTYTCKTCGATKTESIPKLDHTHRHTAVVTAPTCTKKGYTTYTCVCGDTYTAEEVAALGHHEVTDKGYAATCTETGLTDGVHCDRCNTVLTAQKTISATGHAYDEGVVTKDPTEETTGVRTYTCKTCGATKTEEIPKLNHEHLYKVEITDPTCEEKGYTTYTCVCGDTYTAEEVAALGHHEVTDKGYAATCTKAGLTDGVHCDRCDAVLTAQEVIAALGHNEVADQGYAATCTETGLTDGIHCDRCNTVLTAQKTISATGHAYDEGVVTKDPTEETTGVRTYTCKTCGATKREEIPKLNHEHLYKVEITDPTCEEKGYTTYTCVCGDTYTAEEVAALGHHEVTDKGYAATCTKAGLTDGVHCDRCDAVLTAQEVIAALGHNEVADQGYAATCTETGLTDGIHCDRCDAVLTAQEVITALGHNEVADQGYAATCTETGLTDGVHCDRCDAVLTAQEVITALGHNEVADQGYAATCTEDGLTDGVHCDRSNTILTAQETIPATGHAYDEGVVTTEPTEDTTGVRTYTCKNCGDTKTEEIPKLNHEHLYNAEITAPTCTEKGYTTYTCVCGDTYTADEVAALGHNEVTDQGYAPTCTEEGLSDGVHCDRCGAVLTAQTVIPAAGHDFATGTCRCGAKAVVITTQPKTGFAKMGEVAKATVVAEGEGLKYQWYIRNANQDKFSKSACTGDTYSCRMNEKSKNRRALCIITDQYGNKVQSKTIVIREAVSIVTEPKHTMAKFGEQVKVTMEASGDGLTYQWYFRNADQSEYHKASVTDATYTCKMRDLSNNRRLLCIVKDKYGNKVQTKTVVIRMAATITAQPQSVSAKKGEVVETTVQAVGTDLKYQWYIKNAGSEKFVKSSITDATYTVTMSKKVDGREAYCVVTDKYGKTARSSVITLTMETK